jgi:hypothetical protein
MFGTYHTEGFTARERLLAKIKFLLSWPQDNCADYMKYSLVEVRELLAAESASGIIDIIVDFLSLLVDCARMLGL